MKKILLLIIIPILNFAQIDPAELCDSISISFIEYNEQENYIEIQFSTEFLTEYWFGYAGFTITNNQGEVIATETLENAANVYGIGSNMTETRFLQTTENFTSPIGTLNLVNGFFAGGNTENVCSWPLYDQNLYTFEYTKNKKVIKIIDVLGRNMKTPQSLFIYIYEDGHVEKKYMIK